MKIYTRTGDEGTTGLYGGRRVSKSDARVAAYGSVDEASSVLGLARAFANDPRLDRVLAELQNGLFDLGADLATPLDDRARERIAPIDEQDVADLERLIDEFDGELEPLSSFVLPGGNELSAALHLARAVVRRAEREVTALGENAELNPQVRIYLNRLSDLLFILARVGNVRSGVSETRWRARGRTRRRDGRGES